MPVGHPRSLERGPLTGYENETLGAIIATDCIWPHASGHQVCSEGWLPMHSPRIDDLPQRCVVLFKAEQGEIARLHHIANRQLAAWGAPGLANQAHLAITELASKLLAHAIPGSSTTLVLDAQATSLRLELHGTDPRLPTWHELTLDPDSAVAAR